VSEARPGPSATTYALLGLLALRPHTGYELTRQVRTSVSLVWPASESNLYREQHRLVRLGWAGVAAEPAGRRTRKRYTITELGRRELGAWLASPPTPPTLDVEAFVRLWLADQGTVDDLTGALRATATSARATIAAAATLAERYLAGEGAFESRAHLNALAGEMLVDTLGALADRCERAVTEVSGWPTTRDRGLDEETRARLRRIVASAR